MSHKAKLDRIGEETIFAKYGEVQSTRALCIWLGIPPESRAPLYQWLRAVPGRWERWNDWRHWIALSNAEEVTQLVESGAPLHYRSVRKEINKLMWRADRFSQTEP